MKRKFPFVNKLILKKNKAIGKLQRKKKLSVFEKIAYFFLKKVLGFLAKISKNRLENTLVLKKKYVYIGLPKVASTSLKEAFKKNGAKNVSYKKRKDIISNPFFYKFTFVRNPYDRIVSCWKNKVQNPQLRETLGNNQYLGFYKYEKIKSGMPFKEFVRIISKIPDEKADPHFKSQYLSLINKKGKLFVNFIGKFENLEKDYQKICGTIGVYNPTKLKHQRKSLGGGYKSYYDKETKKLIKKRYEKDLKIFNYKY